MIEPRAHSYQVAYCDDPVCQAIHISLLDETGVCFAGMTVGLHNVEFFCDAVQRTAAVVRAKAPPRDRRQ